MWCNIVLTLRIARRRLAGAERGSRVSQAALDTPCERVRATEHAPRGPFHVLERRHGLAEIVERGAGVPVERLRVTPPHLQREFVLGDVFTGDGPRCWPEFGRRWMVENGFEHVRRQTGDPCGNHYPFLFLRRKC